jgi:coenzyme PQQ precursor peptide PqqA
MELSHKDLLPFGTCRLKILTASDFMHRQILAPEQSREKRMTWETPVVQEITCGLEVTAYESADDGIDGLN